MKTRPSTKIATKHFTTCLLLLGVILLTLACEKNIKTVVPEFKETSEAVTALTLTDQPTPSSTTAMAELTVTDQPMPSPTIALTELALTEQPTPSSTLPPECQEAGLTEEEISICGSHNFHIVANALGTYYGYNDPNDEDNLLKTYESDNQISIHFAEDKIWINGNVRGYEIAKNTYQYEDDDKSTSNFYISMGEYRLVMGPGNEDNTEGCSSDPMLLCSYSIVTLLP